ncbi:MAG: hypothetical protein KME15_13420 [Drouetiella hepatica Uher 2000/2452]|jgi:hypothetical protein|uniref:Uncharacterized protein n=1 Tax=Drouetiella hepatica Uher 2000/2452 TaxID=904376 RepID=A0A951QDC7_9CYAN|nr:hypothetical protein [Drouetiella hepatica Uher 2000/2452]
MQDFPLLRKEGVNLYRVCYRINASHEIHRPGGFHDFEVAQKIVADFNTRYGEDCEYFLEQVNLKSLSEDILISLVHQGKLSPKEVLPHLSLKSPYVEIWRSKEWHATLDSRFSQSS